MGAKNVKRPEDLWEMWSDGKIDRSPEKLIMTPEIYAQIKKTYNLP
jgi:hypothetical protein